MSTQPREVVIFGASGGIGAALVAHYAGLPSVQVVHAVARRPEALPQGAKITPHRADLTHEPDIAAVAEAVHAPDMVIVATGMLADPAKGITPEKSYRHQNLAAFEQVFAINTFAPALVAKHLLARMPRKERTIFAALSARVGSISDNGLGGWHAYRASKAALNMLMRNYAIEMSRSNPQSLCVCLHPGTVRTPLSAPFRPTSDSSLFTPEFAAERLTRVLDGLTPDDTGGHFDWNNKGIAP